MATTTVRQLPLSPYGVPERAKGPPAPRPHGQLHRAALVIPRICQETTRLVHWTCAPPPDPATAQQLPTREAAIPESPLLVWAVVWRNSAAPNSRNHLAPTRAQRATHSPTPRRAKIASTCQIAPSRRRSLALPNMISDNASGAAFVARGQAGPNSAWRWWPNATVANLCPSNKCTHLHRRRRNDVGYHPQQCIRRSEEGAGS